LGFEGGGALISKGGRWVNEEGKDRCASPLRRPGTRPEKKADWNMQRGNEKSQEKGKSAWENKGKRGGCIAQVIFGMVTNLRGPGPAKKGEKKMCIDKQSARRQRGKLRTRPARNKGNVKGRRV